MPPAAALLAGAILIGSSALKIIRTSSGAGRRLPWSLGLGVGLVVIGAALLSVPGRTEPREATGTANLVPGDEGLPIEPVDPARAAALEARVARDSSDFPALVVLGHAYLRLDDLPRAAAVTTRALNLKPDSPESAEPYAHMAMVLWAAERDSLAFESIEYALRLQPDLPEALLYHGMLLVATGRDIPGGIAAWERYLRIAPPDANTGRIRAMLDEARSAR